MIPNRRQPTLNSAHLLLTVSSSDAPAPFSDLSAISCSNFFRSLGLPGATSQNLHRKF
jgi:hypothetical protein